MSYATFKRFARHQKRIREMQHEEGHKFNFSAPLRIACRFLPLMSATTTVYNPSTCTHSRGSTSSAPVAGTNPSGTDVWMSGGSAALDSSGNLYNAGQVGTVLSNGNGSQLTDGVPVYWKNGTGTALPMGSGNTWGLAGAAVVGK